MKVLFSIMFFASTFSLLMGMMGCSESVEDTAIILETDPDDGGRLFAEEDLTITFDSTVAWVKVNGTFADVDDTQAYWKGLGLEAGKQDLTIQWLDENGNVDYGEITLTVHELDLATCAGGDDCTGPDCDFP